MLPLMTLGLGWCIGYVIGYVRGMLFVNAELARETALKSKV